MSELLVAITSAIVALILGFLLHKVRKRFLQAQTGEVEVRTLKGLWTQISELLERLQVLESRVTILETENRGLKQTVERFRLLVRRLWSIIIDNELSHDMDLALVVKEALEGEIVDAI